MDKKEMLRMVLEVPLTRGQKPQTVFKRMFPDAHEELCRELGGRLPTAAEVLLFLAPDTRTTCIECGKPTKPQGMQFKEFCSLKCSNSSVVVKAKKSNTCMKNYGVTNPSKSEIVHKKKQETCMANYGVDSPLRSEEIISRVKATNNKRYGGDSPMYSEAVREKQRSVFFEKYGVYNPAENPIIHRKTVKSSFLTHKIVIAGKEFTVQGCAERKLVYELVNKYGVDDVLSQFSDGFPDDKVMNLGWGPDFYIKSKDVFVECKSTWTLARNAKFLEKNMKKAATSVGKVLWIVDVRNRGFMELPEFWYTWPIERLAKFFNMDKLHGV